MQKRFTLFHVFNVFHLQFGSSAVLLPCYYDASLYVSRLPPNSVPHLVRAALGTRRRRSSSHHQSTFHFPFVLSCLLTHLVSISLISCCVFNPLFSPCLCAELFIVSACARFLWCVTGFVPICLWFWLQVVLWIKLLRWLPSFLSCAWLSCRQLRTP
jgi:hypothetical protein